jgi:hypothetical protein
VSSATLSINWQGTASDPFSSTRGLRQGDPISPYLFILCLERLGHSIQDAVVMGNWKPFKVGRGIGPAISHMCFADDLILVAEASSDQSNLIRSILKEFCDASGQKLNLHKSQVFFSNNVSGDLASTLSRDLGIEITKDLGVYLGAPMLHRRASKSDYEFILDKMRKKLSGWKANSLSFAGRVTLAQSSLTSIPGYVIQSSRIPTSICIMAKKTAEILFGARLPIIEKHISYHGNKFAALRRKGA